MHSPLAPPAVAEALRGAMDEERWSSFLLSGYQGNQSILGTVTGSGFYMRKRLYSRNDFARRFYGRFSLRAAEQGLKDILLCRRSSEFSWPFGWQVCSA